MRQGLGEGTCSYLGRSNRLVKSSEKSAEAILGSGNELSLNGGGLTNELKG